VLLLDASVWVALADPRERFHAEAETLVESAGSIATLDLTLLEVANAVGAKMGMPTRAERILGIVAANCGDRLIRADAALVGSAIEVSAEHGLSAYDAAYVAAARRDAMTLVSLDIRDLVSKGLAVTPDAALYP
jgi:predicted nucleic acid-binding protein